jgi:hypothetical protein
MARYRKVDVRIWGDEKFRDLTDRARLLWFYLITAPESTSVPGLYTASRAGIADVLGWDLRAFDRAFDELASRGLVLADWKARVVWVPNAPRYNVPESPNVVRAWAKHVDEVPECDLKTKATEALEAFCKGFGEAYAKAFREAFREASREGCQKGSGKSRVREEQEQEQEQEQDPSGGCEAAPTPPEPAQPEPSAEPPPRRGKARRGKQPDLPIPKPNPTGEAMSAWRKAWAASYEGRTYTDASGDFRLMGQLVKQAAELAKSAPPDKPTTPNDVLAHWFAAYLADGAEFLHEQRHALRFLPRDLPKFGLPWEASKDSEDFEWTEPPEYENTDPPGTVYCGPTPEFLASLEELERKQRLS